MGNTGNVVIIGASHAAAEAISTLRRAGWPGQITLIGDELELPYQRPPLSKAYFKGELEFAKLLLKNEAFYDKAQVNVLLGKRATKLDRQQQSVMLDNGESVFYSHLILATGTRARHLPVAGHDLPQIKVLRTRADVDDIKSALPQGGKLLIVGAGYIGLEVAASAIKNNIDVTVLEAQERVLSRVTGEHVSGFFQKRHAKEGVDIRLGASLQSFVNQGAKAYAKLGTGEDIPFDCAIVGIGVVPNVELAQDAGLACDNGILVDEYARTNDANIFAVGDCANHFSALYRNRIRLESVPNAVAQAKTAALFICGKPQPYNQLPWFWSDQYDIKLQTAGLLSGYDRSEIQGDPDEAKFTVSYYKQDKLIALDAINAPAEFMKAKKAIIEALSAN